LVVVSYAKGKERLFPAEPEGTPADVAVLEHISELLRANRKS
jgi:large conductance mechanosensitive channel